MLTVEGLEAGYGTSRVLFGMSLEAKAGQVVSLIGRNGMGKSTTVRAIMGMVKPRAGRLQFDDRDIAGLAPMLSRVSGSDSSPRQGAFSLR
jgi:branched-chain amino acid transport system ATP-binding protein